MTNEISICDIYIRTISIDGRTGFSLLPYISTLDIKRMTETIMSHLTYEDHVFDFSWFCVKTDQALFLQFYCNDIRSVDEKLMFTATYRNLSLGTCYPVYWNFQVRFKQTDQYYYLSEVITAGTFVEFNDEFSDEFSEESVSYDYGDID
jgi:hypothetical protein